MADSKKKSPDLDEGFNEIPLDKGFQDIPLTDEEKAATAKYVSAPEVPLSESIRAGYANGGTFGLAPRIGGAMGAGMEKLAGAPLGPEGFSLIPGHESSKDKKLSDLYEEYKKYNEQRQAAAKAGNPIAYGGAQFVGAIASPLNKIGAAGELGANAPLVAKMGQGALAGARMGTIAGAAQSPDLTNIPQTLENAGEGAALGAGIGAAVPPAGAALKGAAGAVGSFGRKLIGQPGTMFSKGMQAGMEGAPNIAGEPGQLQAVEQRDQFANRFVQDLHKALSGNAKNKRELISQALENSQLAPAEAVQAVTQKYLEANPQLNEETARKELAQLKEMILTAREGPLKTETVRQYAENAPKGPLPGAQPVIPGPAEREAMPAPPAPMPPIPAALGLPPPSPQGAPPAGPGANLPVPVAPPSNVPGAPIMPEGVTGEAARMQPTPESQVVSEGYEKIHGATIKAGDEKAREAFEHKVREKLAEEQSLGKNVNPNDVHIDEIPIEDSDKVRLVAKRAKMAEEDDKSAQEAQAFAEKQKQEAKVLTDKQKQQQKLQDLLDRQNEEKMKMQAQQDAEMAKPQFQDVQQTVREGGRNLQNPEELYALQQNLKAKSQFSEGRGFSSQEMNRMSGDAAKDIAQLIKLSVPGTIPVDERLTAFNNVAESLGIDTDKLMQPGGEGEKARSQAMQKILGVLKPAVPTDKAQTSQRTVNYVQQELNKVHPDIGQAFGQEAAKHAETEGTMQELTNPGTVGGGGPILSATRRIAGKTAYGLGHAVGSEVQKMQPGIEAGKKVFQNFTPDVLQKAGAAASQSTNQAVQQMGQVLSKLATADDRTRNSMMFVLQQQAGYRQLMAPYFPKAEAGTPQAKDKSLELYK